METQWYYANPYELQGPFDGSRLMELAKSGALAATDWLWNDQLTEWVPARRVRGLEFQMPILEVHPRRTPEVGSLAGYAEGADGTTLCRFWPGLLVLLIARLLGVVACQRAMAE